MIERHDKTEKICGYVCKKLYDVKDYKHLVDIENAKLPNMEEFEVPEDCYMKMEYMVLNQNEKKS